MWANADTKIFAKQGCGDFRWHWHALDTSMQA
jgi:hypothetical protein